MKQPSSLFLKWLRDVGQVEAFSTLADLMPDTAVFAVDADKSIVYWNSGAERLLGFSADEVLGQHCLKGSRCAECMGGCGLTEYGTVHNRPLRMYRADGQLVNVRKHGRAFMDDEGAFLGGIEILVPDTAGEKPSLSLLPDAAGAEGEPLRFHGIVSRDRKMREIFHIIRNVAETEATVLVRGESGTGKELVARALHAESSRSDHPFLAVNCAAMTPTLLESELFGHEKGAFTGAVKEHKGLFERANGGTLFLDEVAELPLELQAKLLRVLQERTFFRVGGSRPISVDVRIVSATHRSLREEVAAGRFRADLMYRLRVVPLFLPALRERKGDIPLILEHYLNILNERGRRQVHHVSPNAMRALLDYSWPGNVRELLNVLEYAFAVGRGSDLDCEDLPPEVRRTTAALQAEPVVHASPNAHRWSTESPAPSSQPGAGSDTLDEADRIREALRRFDGHVGKSADWLGMSRPTFWRKRKKYGL